VQTSWSSAQIWHFILILLLLPAGCWLLPARWVDGNMVDVDTPQHNFVLVTCATSWSCWLLAAGCWLLLLLLLLPPAVAAAFAAVLHAGCSNTCHMIGNRTLIRSELNMSMVCCCWLRARAAGGHPFSMSMALAAGCKPVLMAAGLIWGPSWRLAIDCQRECHSPATAASRHC